MDRRSFASLLISGKLGLGLISGLGVSSAKALSLEDCASGVPQVGLLSTPQGVDFQQNSDPYGSAEAEIVLNVPGINCSYQLPDRLQLVLSGLKAGDEVHIGISTGHDDPYILSITSNKIRLGGDIMILSHFYFEYPEVWPSENVPFNGADEDTGACYVVPVILPPDLSAYTGQEFYLQALVFRGGDYSWEGALVSELVRIRVQTQDCSSYGGSAY